MLPTPTPAIVLVEIAKHAFRFRRLTWRDEVRFHELAKTDTKVSQLSYAAVSVDGKTLTPQVAQRFIMALPRPVREKLVILYRGQLPMNRLLDAEIPVKVPEPRLVQALIDDEVEEAEQSQEAFLEQRFGREEALEAQRQAQAIAEAAQRRNLVPATPEDPIDESVTLMPVPDQAQAQPQSRRYMNVM